LCDDGIPNNGVDSCLNGYCQGAYGPYDCKANTCSPDASSPPDLTCWLNTHWSIRTGIRWHAQDSDTTTYWEDWTPEKKQELQKAFLDAWQWLAGGMTNFQGTPIPEPPPNSVTFADNEWDVYTIFTEETAWPFYLAKLAHSLAIEIGHWVPWSLCDYPIEIQQMLLASHGGLYWWSGYYTDWNYPLGYLPYGLVVTPAHPTVTYPFLYQNGLIGATQYETIARLLDWSRLLEHWGGTGDAAGIEAYWQYRGNTPVSRMIEGTKPPNMSFGHYTGGCGCTSGFLQDVLRSVNIPVIKLEPCLPHQTPYFPSEGLYLSHGDDPYCGWWKHSTVVPQLGEMLIDQATYLNWFTGSDEYVRSNIGRRCAELMLKYLPDPLVTYYCWDVAANTPHDSGDVYDSFKKDYTVEELEAADLWGRLCQRAIELGSCNCQ